MNSKIIFAIKDKKGFGMIELLITIVIVGIGMTSLMTLMAKIIFADQQSYARVIALNLAREGTEVVRNIRDSNWITGRQWDDGFSNNLDYTAIADFDISLNTWKLDFIPNLIDDQLTRLYLDELTGLYSHDVENKQTQYNRLLHLKLICFSSITKEEIIRAAGESCVFGEEKIGLEVVSTVQWVVLGNPGRNITVVNKLYNWR